MFSPNISLEDSVIKTVHSVNFIKMHNIIAIKYEYFINIDKAHTNIL